MLLFSWYKHSWVTDLGYFLKHTSLSSSVPFELFRSHIYTGSNSEASPIFSEDDSHGALGHSRSVSVLNFLFSSFFFEDGSWTKTVQLWQSKLCCLSVGVLALSPTRTVCLANKKENVFTLDLLPSASKKNTMDMVSKVMMAQRGKIIQYPDE